MTFSDPADVYVTFNILMSSFICVATFGIRYFLNAVVSAALCYSHTIEIPCSSSGWLKVYRNVLSVFVFGYPCPGCLHLDINDGSCI